MSLDAAGSNRLGPAEQLAFFKGVDRRLSAQQLRLLMMHVRYLYSTGGDGTVSFIDLLRAFKVVGITRGAPNSAGGGAGRAADGAGSSGGYGGSSAGGGAVGREYEWKLKDVYDAQGRHYLMDEETKVDRAWPSFASPMRVAILHALQAGGCTTALASRSPCLAAALGPVAAQAEGTERVCVLRCILPAHHPTSSPARRSCSLSLHAPRTGPGCMAAWTPEARCVSLHCL